MASTFRTLNHYEEFFRDLAGRHNVVRDYGFSVGKRSLGTTAIDDFSDPGASRDLNYPVLWIMYTGSQLVGGDVGNDGFRVIRNSFDVFCFDLLLPDFSNQRDALSDTQAILIDIINESVNDEFFQKAKMQVEGNVNLEPFVDATDESVAGHKAVITLRGQAPIFCGNPLVDENNGYAFDN